METVVRGRVALLVAGVILASAGLVARLFQLQVTRSEQLRAQARRQHEKLVQMGGSRGDIVDRNGHELAVSVATSSLYAHPWRVEDPTRAAMLLAPVLESTASSLREKLASDEGFVWLKRRLEPAKAQAVLQLGLKVGKGQPFGFETEGKRYYPQGFLAVHVLGFAGADQKGIEGIERELDRVLQGDSSGYLAFRDGRGFMVMQLVRPPGKQAHDVVLTLDLTIQHVVERELERAMTETHSKAASAILLDPATGQILALANRPTVNANAYGPGTADQKRNRAVTDFYEPGSTFKVITVAAALDNGKVSPGQWVNCENGAIVIASRRIRDHDPHGVLTVGQILEKSSNVGAIKIGRALPHEVFYNAIRRLGFGARTGIELPGESPGQITPLKRWSALSPASMSMGQEIGVTALQMASAFAAIANDGILIPPRVVLGIRDSNGRLDLAPPPEPKRVLSTSTASTLASMLEGVVVRGTGTLAAVPGYRIAGKTGTAQKVIPGVGYSHSEFMASFAGLGPIGSCRLAGIVVLDTPKGGRYYGGQVAAPVFSRIMADALAYLRVPPDTDPVVTRDERVDKRRPSPRGAKRREPLEEPPHIPIGPGMVPDLEGLSLRRAVAQLVERGYRARVVGEGVVVDQIPSAGNSLEQGQACVLQLGTRVGKRSRATGPDLIASNHPPVSPQRALPKRTSRSSAQGAQSARR